MYVYLFDKSQKEIIEGVIHNFWIIYFSSFISCILPLLEVFPPTKTRVSG